VSKILSFQYVINKSVNVTFYILISHALCLESSVLLSLTGWASPPVSLGLCLSLNQNGAGGYLTHTAHLNLNDKFSLEAPGLLLDSINGEKLRFAYQCSSKSISKIVNNLIEYTSLS
jgi:hypothetical protein